MLYDLISAWTALDVATIEESLLRELSGEFVPYPDGSHSVMFGNSPGEAVVLRATRDSVDDPQVSVIVENRDPRRRRRRTAPDRIPGVRRTRAIPERSHRAACGR